jgi:hypothetical protein
VRIVYAAGQKELPCCDGLRGGGDETALVNPGLDTVEVDGCPRAASPGDKCRQMLSVCRQRGDNERTGS